MLMRSSRPVLFSLALLALSPVVATVKARAERPALPQSVTFRGEDRFRQLVGVAERENWRALSLGERTARVGLALAGTPYANFTLEIHDRVESPSANLIGLDCWTFYEISLGFARMLRAKAGPYAPEDLLSAIEQDRYRNGVCTGAYLSRFHFLEDLFQDNERRGLLTDVTRRLPGAERMGQRQVREMSVMWRHYRYLRNNPGLLPEMAQIEARDSALPVYHVPRRHIPEAEADIQTGDVVAITSRDEGGYTSHVGLAVRDAGGTVRFLHASSKQRRVVLDERLSRYVSAHSDDFGIIVVRPRELPAGILGAGGSTVAAVP